MVKVAAERSKSSGKGERRPSTTQTKLKIAPNLGCEFLWILWKRRDMDQMGNVYA